MPPARKSATRKPATRASRATQGVRARAASTRQATRREVEQSIARFEKRLDDANDALKALGGHLGRGSQRSYKEVTTALAALRREAAKTNKQALKDFDKLTAPIADELPRKARHREFVVKGNCPSSTAAKSSSTAAKSSSTAKKATTGSKRTSSRSTRAQGAPARTTASRSTSSRSAGTRSKSTRAKKAS